MAVRRDAVLPATKGQGWEPRIFTQIQKLLGIQPGGLREIEVQHSRMLDRGPAKVSAFTVPKMMAKKVVIKITPSMLTDDLQPSRLESVRTKLHDLIRAYVGHAAKVIGLLEPARRLGLPASVLALA